MKDITKLNTTELKIYLTNIENINNALEKEIEEKKKMIYELKNQLISNS